MNLKNYKSRRINIWNISSPTTNNRDKLKERLKETFIKKSTDYDNYAQNIVMIKLS